MDDKITLTYCLCDDLLNALGHHQDKQTQMSDAEVMTTAIVAALHFGANFEKARTMLQEQGYIQRMLSKSQFNRRLCRLQEPLMWVFRVLAQSWKHLNLESVYLIDSFPVAALDNIRIREAYRDERYRGYTPSKRRYFFGVKVHLLVSVSGEPVEFFLSPGGVADVDALKVFDLDLPAGATIYADKAYTDYACEDMLVEALDIHLMPIRKKNSKRQVEACVRFVQQHARQAVERANSLIARMLPKSIHAVTARGFELKVMLFILAYSINCL
jgi:hypothetical protein